jgi:carbon starvation protein
LLYVIIAFTDLTTASFAKLTRLSFAGIEGAPEEVVVIGAGVASSALAYLLISLGMGVAVARFRLPFAPVAAVAVLLVGLSIWLGQHFPLAFPDSWTPVAVNRVWNATLLGYCFLASVLPMWLLLQPRGFLGSIFLYTVIIAGVAGTILGGATGSFSIQFPFWKEAPENIGPMLPFLFITIACGACSGFHSIVATGTTSKQLDRERDIKPVAYGAMLMEAMVSILALSTLMLLTPDQAKGLNPDAIFAGGLGRFLGLFGIPVSFAVAFGLLAFSTFIFDTLDVCTRLGRYVFQEFFGWEHPMARYVATGVTLVFPLIYLMVAPDNAWRQFWTIFGTSNQLLAALTLVGLSVWMRHEKRNPWPVLLPAIFMLGMTAVALFHNARAAWSKLTGGVNPIETTQVFNLGIAVGLMLLGTLVTIEAVRAFIRRDEPIPAV